jgi:hypothetical protein
MIKQVRALYTFKGNIVNRKFVDKFNHLYLDQPSNEEIEIMLNILSRKTKPDRFSFLLIDENGKMTMRLNEKVSFEKDFSDF